MREKKGKERKKENTLISGCSAFW